MPKTALKATPLPPLNPPSPPVTEHPIHRIQFGLVRGSIWRAGTSDTAVYSLTLDRVVTDKAKNEQVSQLFKSADLRHLVKVTADCARWIEWQLKRLAEEAARRQR